VSLAERRRLRIFTLCVLYVAQGIPWGFTATTLPGYLTDQKLDQKFVAATLAFTTLPYAFKWVWGPIIDTVTIRRLGRRRPWIIFAQLMMAATIATMLALDVKAQVVTLAWMVFFHTIFNSLQDVAVDGERVDVLPENERGIANGLMYGAKYGGGALGGVGMAKLIAWKGLDTALTAQVCVLLAIVFVPLLVRERDGEPPPRQAPREIANGLLQAFSLRSPQMLVLVMLAANAGIGFVSANGYDLFIKVLKWKPEHYAEIVGGWGLLAGGVCAALAGGIADRIGRRRLVTICALGLSANWALFALNRDWWSNHDYIYASAIIENAFTAGFSVGLIALCMDVSWPRVAGSQFTAYMALSNFSTTLGSLASSYVNKTWSYPKIWLVAAGGS
jgi:PAT family beta-lactamase induction signal transducer AmpG